jgi:hypothetical protein
MCRFSLAPTSPPHASSVTIHRLSPGMIRTQIGMFRPIRMDHTNCLQVAIKTLQFNWVVIPFPVECFGSMTVLTLVLSMLSLPCDVDDLPSGLVDVVFGLSWILRDLESLFPPWKERSLGAFVRNTVRRDVADNLLDWGLSLLLVWFTSLVDNYLVDEVH